MLLLWHIAIPSSNLRVDNAEPLRGASQKDCSVQDALLAHEGSASMSTKRLSLEGSLLKDRLDLVVRSGDVSLALKV